MSLYEALTLVSLWCGGGQATDQRFKTACQKKLFECLVLDDIALDRKNVVGCFKNTRIV
jgi:hypothetical protein